MTTYPTLTPHLAVRDAAAALDWYVTAFGATEVQRFAMPDGTVPHAELLLGDALISVGEAMEEYQQVAPTVDGPVQGALTWLVPAVDPAFEKAVEHGATVVDKPADGPFGLRTATLRDPFGHRWILAQHLRDVSVADQQAAFQDMIGG